MSVWGNSCTFTYSISVSRSHPESTQLLDFRLKDPLQGCFKIYTQLQRGVLNGLDKIIETQCNSMAPQKLKQKLNIITFMKGGFVADLL